MLAKDEQCFTYDDLKRRWNCCWRTAANKVAKGIADSIVHPIKLGRSVRFRPDEIDALERGVKT